MVYTTKSSQRPSKACKYTVVSCIVAYATCHIIELSSTNEISKLDFSASLSSTDPCDIPAVSRGPVAYYSIVLHLVFCRSLARCHATKWSKCKTIGGCTAKCLQCCFFIGWSFEDFWSNRNSDQKGINDGPEWWSNGVVAAGPGLWCWCCFELCWRKLGLRVNVNVWWWAEAWNKMLSH